LSQDGVAMLRLAVVGLLVGAVAGCAPGSFWTGGTQPGTLAIYDNPVVVAGESPEFVWETVVDVVDDYFDIQTEEPARRIDGVATEGRLETFPEVGSTLLEPWRNDSANTYEKIESTLQSIRRQAVVHVMPTEDGRGYALDVAVYKQLEDCVKPLQADAGAATFRYDSSLTRVIAPVGEAPIDEGWIFIGRDTALEQRILGQLLSRIPVLPRPAAPLVPVGCQ
jgi:hypothetical protein